MVNDKSDSFKQLYTTNYRRAFMLVKRYVHDEEVAEDIVSDVMIKLWQMMQDTVLDSEEAMLLTLLHNTTLNYLKRKQIEAKALENVTCSYRREMEIRISNLEDCTPNLTAFNEINNLVDATLSQLSLLTQEIFRMSRYENKTNKKISTFYNISIKAVEYHISRALQTLRVQLKDYLPITFLALILFLF
jgi:RNA polymerase sigma-70 factor (ECF subfamily)